jgi:RNA polymerase sigma-70 factor, ECF subfamily
MNTVVKPKEDDRQPINVGLVLAARDGDMSAQEALFRRYRKMVFGMAARLMGTTDVEDLVQDTFVEAFTNLRRLREPALFVTWLGAIVVRTAHNRWWRSRLLERLGITRSKPADIESLVSASAPPDMVAEMRQVYRVVASLPADAQIALVLHRVEGMTLEEVAVHMDKSLATVKRRVAEGAAQLDRILNGEGRRLP